MFNPIPKDAPEFFSDRAHYVNDKETKSKYGNEQKMTRFYVFSIGRSKKRYHLRDKYLDDRALEMLEESRENGTRLIVKGYNSPALYGSSMFVVLTHFGIYHRLYPGFRVINPNTGEIGYYKLRAE